MGKYEKKSAAILFSKAGTEALQIPADNGSPKILAEGHFRVSDENRGSDKTSEPVHDDLSPEVSAGSSITDSIHATSEVLAGVSARPVPHTRPTVAIYGAYGGPAVSPFDEEDREPCWLQILSGAATVGLAEDDCSVTLAAEEDAEACWLSILGDDETITMDEDDGSTSATTASVPSTAASTVPDYLGAQLAAFALKDSSAPHTTDISNGTPAPGHSTHAPEVTKAAMTSPIANSSSSQPKSAVTPVLASRDLPSDFTGHLQSAASGLSIPGVALTAVPKFGLGVPAVSAHASPGLANDEPVTHTPRTGPHGVQSTMLVRGDQPPAPVAQGTAAGAVEQPTKAGSEMMASAEHNPLQTKVNMPERLPSIPSPMLMPEALPRLVEQPRMLMPEALPRLLEQPRMLMPEVLPPVPTPVGRPVLHQVEGSRLGKVLSLGLDMTGNVVYSTAGAACGTLQALASLARHPLSSTTGASTQGLPATKAPAARLALPAVPTIPLQKPVTRLGRVVGRRLDEGVGLAYWGTGVACGIYQGIVLGMRKPLPKSA